MDTKQDGGGNVFGGVGRVAVVVLLIGGMLPFMAPATHAALDAYLRIPGIEGTSKDAAHKNWVTASSVVSENLNGDAQADREELAVRKAGGSNDKAAIGSGSGSGKVAAAAAPRDVSSGQTSGKRVHQPFTITKEVDAASPKLFQACASGQHISEVDVDLGSAHYKLTDVVISSDTKSGGARPMETLTFNYTKIEMVQ